MTWSVHAETKEGNSFMLRGGFKSEDAANDHPVTLADWKRVWVVKDHVPTKAPPAPNLPPFPWGWNAAQKPDAQAQFQIYLTDASGKRIGCLWGGTPEQRKLVADYITERCNAGGRQP